MFSKRLGAAALKTNDIHTTRVAVHENVPVASVSLRFFLESSAARYFLADRN